MCLCDRFMLDLKREKRQEYLEKVTSMAATLGLKVSQH